MGAKKPKQDWNCTYDIMIVGGGPAGISTWLHLQKIDPSLASKAVLLEKETYPRDKLCGGALHKWMTKRIFSDIGIELTVPFVPVHRLEIRLEKDVYTYQEEEFFRVVRRAEFDHSLARIAQDRGMHLREGEACVDVEYGDDDVLVTTTKDTYKVKMLIGADGALSVVRRTMKPLIIPRYAATLEVFSPAHTTYDPEYATHTATMDFSPVIEGLQGYVWHFPCLQGTTPFMNHGICDTRMYPDVSRNELKKIFLHELQRRNIDQGPSSWSSHPVTYFLQDVPLSQPHVLLVGDAAGIEPLLGGGIHLSLAYGDVAATTIADAFRRDDYSCKSYTQRLHDHYLGKYIRKFTSVAQYVYADKTRILDSLARIIENKG